jgi:hypothetical protein
MSNTTLNQLLDKHAFGEVTSTLEGVDLKRPASEMLENVNRALETIAETGRHPVIVIDDSDSFTRRQGSGSPREQLIETYDKDRQILNLAATITLELLPDFDPNENDRPGVIDQRPAGI